MDKRYESQLKKMRVEIRDLQRRVIEADESAKNAETERDAAEAANSLTERYLPFADFAVFRRFQKLRRQHHRLAWNHRDLKGQVTDHEKKFDEHLHKALRNSDSGYKKILARANKARDAREWCSRMLGFVDSARTLIKENLSASRTRGKAPPAAADTAAQQVTTAISTVQRHATEARRVSPFGRFDTRRTQALRTDFSSHAANIRGLRTKFRETDTKLDRIERTVKDLCEAIENEEKAIEDERLRYFENVRKQFE